MFLNSDGNNLQPYIHTGSIQTFANPAKRLFAGRFYFHLLHFISKLLLILTNYNKNLDYSFYFVFEEQILQILLIRVKNINHFLGKS